MNKKNAHIKKLLKDIDEQRNTPYERDILWSIHYDIKDLLEKLTGGDEYPNNFSKKEAKEHMIQMFEYLVKDAK
jgi:hypothetical protein